MLQVCRNLGGRFVGLFLLRQRRELCKIVTRNFKFQGFRPMILGDHVHFEELDLGKQGYKARI
ncbi:MAG: hypothetical protein ACRETQ_12490, partial [Gammaproteobacteria bacterium]